MLLGAVENQLSSAHDLFVTYDRAIEGGAAIINFPGMDTVPLTGDDKFPENDIYFFTYIIFLM